MSLVSIYNLGLGRVGEGQTVSSPDEQSRQAELCRQFFPIARRSLLELHDFNFATRGGALTELAENVNAGRWGYAYALPNEALRVWKVGPEATYFNGYSQDAGASQFEIEDGTIFTDEPFAFARWSFDQQDVTRFSPLFVDALGWMLAAYLAGPIIKGEAGRNESRALRQEATLTFGQAARSDTNQRRQTDWRKTHKPDWLDGRGFTPAEDNQLAGQHKAIPNLYPAT